MKRFFLILSFILFQQVSAQVNHPTGEGLAVSDPDPDPNETIYTVVEKMPEYPGGLSKFYEFVSKHFHAPADVKGKILVRFVVEKDGSITNINVVRNLGSGTAEEALRVLKSSPKWRPGFQNGRPVRVYFSLPIVL